MCADLAMTEMGSVDIASCAGDRDIIIDQALPHYCLAEQATFEERQSSKLQNPGRPLATQRLQKQYLHAIPFSPPVALNILDKDGNPIHPLQLSHKPAQLAHEDGCTPLASPARSTVSERASLSSPGLNQGKSHAAPGRPPQAFIQRHDSQRSESSQTSSSGNSRALSTSSSPLAGSPMSPSPLMFSALSPLSPSKVSINGRKKGLTERRHHHGNT